MKLVFIWIQWSGKWTLARLICEKYDFKFLEMGQELRKISETNTKLWLKIRYIMNSWNLIDPEIVWEIMKEILSNKENDNLILDWFIRNEWNKKSLDNIIDDYKFVLFEINKEKAVKRLLWRMYNPSTWETFTSEFSIDPHTWETLDKRKDDNELSILKRVDDFMNITLPLALEQEKTWKLIRLNADQSIDDVFKELVYKLSL